MRIHFRHTEDWICQLGGVENGSVAATFDIYNLKTKNPFVDISNVEQTIQMYRSCR